MDLGRTRIVVIAILTVLAATTEAGAQLAQPTLSAENVGWGWFDLRMTGNSITPTGTHWLITNEDGTQTLFDSWRHRAECEQEIFPGVIEGDFVADTRDLTSKSILGCHDNRTFVANVRYTNGTEWSPFSESITINTPPEPTRSDDTVYIVMYGHSLAAYSSSCGMNIGDGILISEDDGYSIPGGGNTFGHSLQTELRRITGRTVTIINWAISGSRQSRWMRSGIGGDTAVDQFEGESYENFIRFYRAGDGRYLDTSRYRIAAFVFGQNDAREPQYCAARSYPPGLYASDAASIIKELTDRGVCVVYNSIHYGRPKECEDPFRWFAAPLDAQLAYYSAWDSLMNVLVPANPRLWRGLDFFTLFRSDSVRYHFPDRIHPNLSEGIPGIVRPMALIFADAIEGKSSSVTSHGATSVAGLRVAIAPNPTMRGGSITLSSDHERYATVELRDALGRSVGLLFAGYLGTSEQRLDLSNVHLAAGEYFCLVSTNGRTVVRRMVVTK